MLNSETKVREFEHCRSNFTTQYFRGSGHDKAYFSFSSSITDNNAENNSLALFEFFFLSLKLENACMIFFKN